MSILLFILALGILVATHEWGHFAVAKLCGVGVEVFSIGFGPKILGFRKGETEYRFSLIPLGGYVKMVGEDPEDDTAALAYPDKAFSKKSVWARLATVLAGPAMNILVTLVLLPIVFMVGKNEVAIFKKAPVVMGVLAHSPAEASGLQINDHILSVATIPTESWSDLLKVVALRAGETVSVKIDRGGEVLEKSVNLAAHPYESSQIGYLGVEPTYLLEAIVGEVKPGTPSESAGLQPGDVIADIDGHPIHWWVELMEDVGTSQGRTLDIGILRNGAPMRVNLKPMANPEVEEGRQAWLIGIAPKAPNPELVFERHGFVEAMKRGWDAMKDMTDLTIETLKRLFSFNLSYKSLSGPIGIAAAGSQAAAMGFGNFLYFLAFLSLNLGVLNLLPIPMLDGGHVAFMAIEGVIRREIPPRVKGLLQMAFMVLLIGLMILVTTHDIDSIWGFKSLFKMVKGWF